MGCPNNRYINTFNTSLNQVPAIVKHYKSDLDGCAVLNFGCGRGWQKTEEYLCDSDVYNYDINLETHNTLPDKLFDRVVCANVLNVIKDEDEIVNVINTCLSLTNDDGKVYISIYQGNGTGLGEVTSKGYQRNDPAKYYEKYLKGFIRKGNEFILTK
jgi:hypothetical protein